MPIETTPRAGDLLEQFGPEVYRRAYDKGMSVSMYLEQQDPSTEYKDGLDAFGRVLKAAGIRTKSLPEHGVSASTWEDFHRTPQTRALIHEWATRVWRSTTHGSMNTRALYQSDDSALNTFDRPYFDRPGFTWDTEIAPAIPIREVIALSTAIDGNAFRSFYLVGDADETSMTRVAETAEVPRVKLTSGEKTIDLHKYGRSLEASYEMLRRQRLDKIALHIRRMAVQTEIDKLAEAINVLINGDGNANTAATSYNLTTLDSAATAGTLTLKGWLSFKMKFANPFVVTHALTRENIALQMFMLNMGSANVPLVSIQGPSGFGQFTQINPGLADAVRIGWTDDVPANKILAWDRRLGIEQITEIGGNIQEVERFTTRQTEVLTLTEMNGWAVIDGQAAKILDVNA